jgi:hypothetical protein
LARKPRTPPIRPSNRFPRPPEAPKPVVNSTAQVTLELWRAGRSIDEIATERGLATSTIENHLAQAIANGEPIDPRAFYTADEEAEIRAALDGYPKNPSNPSSSTSKAASPTANSGSSAPSKPTKQAVAPPHGKPMLSSMKSLPRKSWRALLHLHPGAFRRHDEVTEGVAPGVFHNHTHTKPASQVFWLLRKQGLSQDMCTTDSNEGGWIPQSPLRQAVWQVPSP